jgi:hypothetical protein
LAKNQARDFNSQFQNALSAVVTLADADVVFYWGPIGPHCDCDLELKINRLGRISGRPNVVLFLTTDGGSADVAYRIGRALQRRVGKDGVFRVVVHSYCKSAGTLVALGADEIAISDRGELGPLDVQLRKKDELDEYSSGLTPLHALSTLRIEAFNMFVDYFEQIREFSWHQISTTTAAQIASRLTTECFSTIYQQIDPLRLGEDERAMDIAFRYGLRLNRGNLKEGALKSLVSDYPSHAFVIDREEAADLFHEVNKPSEPESKLWKLMVERINVSSGVPRNDFTLIEYFPGLKDNDRKSKEGDQRHAKRKTQSKQSQAKASSPPPGPDRKGTPKKNRTQIEYTEERFSDNGVLPKRETRRRGT